MDNKYYYVSESHFIVRVNHALGKYIVDKINQRVKKPEWSEYKGLVGFFDYISGKLCTNMKEESLTDNRTVLLLEVEDRRVKINKAFVIPGGQLYISGKRDPVYEIIGKMENPDAVVMILPINW